VDARTICPGCGLRSAAGGVEPDRRVNASPACWGLHAELVGFELSDPVLVGRYHQLTVDTYGAQHAGLDARSLRVYYSLVGLALALERGRSGAEVRAIHARMGRPQPWWPDLPRPASMGPLTVADVVEAGARAGSPEGHGRSMEAWARSVWAAWEASHGVVRELVDRLLA
jgi:hypothetical protein